MANYYLTYFEAGKKEKVELKKIECLKKYDVSDIKTIDDFTTSFDDKEKLLEFLKRNDIIPANVKHLFISSDYECEKNEVKKIHNGEKILYKNDRKLLSPEFTSRWFLIAIKRNPHLIIRICDCFINKYKTVIAEIYENIRNFVIRLEKNKDFLSIDESKKYSDLLDKMYEFEFYKKGTEKKEERKKWRNIHDFAIILKDIDESVNYHFVIPKEYVKKEGYLVREEEIFNPIKIEDNQKKEEIIEPEQPVIETEKNIPEKSKNKKYEEEFLTREDFDIKDEEDILSHYKKPDYELERDGQDYIKPKDKDELKRDLKTLATQILETQNQNRTK